MKKTILWIFAMILLVSSVFAYEAIPAPNIYYDCDEGSGNLISSGTDSGVEGSPTGTPTYSEPGVEGTAIKLDTADAINISWGSGWYYGNVFTINVWINISSSMPDGKHMFSAYDSAPQTYFYILYDHPTRTVVEGSMDTTTFTSGTEWGNVDDSHNRMWTFVGDGTNIIYYMNGTQLMSNARHGGNDSLQRDLAIGGRLNDGSFDSLDGAVITIDEMMIYEGNLSPAQIIELYNGTSIGTPSTWDGSSWSNAVGEELNLSVGYPLNNTQFDVTIINTNVSFNSSEVTSALLYVNDALNQTRSSIAAGTDIIASFNTTFGDGTYNYYIQVNHSTYGYNTTNNTFFVDIVDPVIAWTTPTNGSLVYGTLNADATLTDSNLFMYEYNITNSAGGLVYNGSNHTLTGITEYNFTANISLTNYSQMMNFTLEVCDGHTKNNIDDFEVVKTSNQIFFDDVILFSLVTPKEITYNKEKDRYSFSFTYNTPISKIDVEVPERCHYLPNSKYKGHFVCPQDKKWLDFEGNYGVSVQGHKVTITSETPLTQWDFNSIGELNCITETQQFQTINTTGNYTKRAIESNDYNFTLTINGQDLNVTADFIYNNTIYSTTISNHSDHYNFTTLLHIPITWINTSDINITPKFYWNFTINGTAYNTSVFNQTVYKIYLDNCTLSVLAPTTLNMTFLNVTDDAKIYIDFEGAFNVWYNNASLYRNYSWAKTTTNNFSVCIYPSWATYYTDATLSYTYLTETFNYNLNDYKLNSTLKTLDLYVSDGTTLVTFTVIDQDDKEQEGVFIYVMAYDVGTNSYDTVEILETDYQGKTLGNIVLNTQPYKFLLYQNGLLALETSNTYITGTSRTLRIDTREDYFTNFNVYRGIASSISFNNATQTFSFTYADPTGTIHEGCLKVIRRTPNGDTIINDTCTTSSAATILSSIGGNATNTYGGIGYVKFDEEKVLQSLWHTFTDNWQRYGAEGILINFLVTVAFVTLGIFSPVGAIFMMILAFAATNIIGLYYLNTGYFIGFIILGIMAIIMISKKE